jgi:ABC-type glycerol-3-phosphate transport system permease component
MFPLPVALALLRSTYSESYGPIIAGAALSALPLLVVFMVANRRIVEGVRPSGLKGQPAGVRRPGPRGRGGSARPG